jgi:KaiC/GvpD/RAD55 family RecA-like ATPase
MFFSNLKKLGTSVVTLEEPLDGNLSNPSLVVPLFLSNSIINIKNLGYGEAFNRTIRIIKHRGSWHAEGVFPYRILSGFGIFIEGTKIAVKSRKKVDVDKILKEHKISKKDIEESFLKRMQRLTESQVGEVEDAIFEVIKNIKR